MAKMSLQQEIDQVFEHLCCYDRWEWDELVAAIQAQALRDAANAADEDPEFRDPLRLKADWMRDRADTIEKEAGR